MINQLAAAPTTFAGVVNIFISLINGLILMLAGLSLVVFFWGLASFIFKAGDKKAIEEGKSLMVWGVISLFVMVALTGIIIFLQKTFGITGTFGLPLLPPQ